MGTITKALALLNHFSASRAEIGLADFTRLAGHDKATVYRHLTELAENGFVEQDPQSKRYRIGAAVLRLANVRESTFPARSAVLPLVTALSRDLGELVHVSLLQGSALSPLCHADPQIHGTRVHLDEAELLPLHATSSGIAVLAFGPSDLSEAVLLGDLVRHTDATPTTPGLLRTLIEAARVSGHAATHGTFESEVSSLAMPVFGQDGRAIGAIAVAYPSARHSEGKVAAILAALAPTQSAVTAALGGVPPRSDAA